MGVGKLLFTNDELRLTTSRR